MNLDPQYEYRIGYGDDIHRLQQGLKLMLGGRHIPHHSGLLAHSDGDVALHALIDAIVGAAGLGDIGTLFPDNDPELKNIDSKSLVLAVREIIEDDKWEVVNVDITIHAEEPKLGPHKKQIQRCIASLIGSDFLAVNIKAKTAEGLGPVGEQEAISSAAVVLLRRRLKRTL